MLNAKCRRSVSALLLAATVSLGVAACSTTTATMTSSPAAASAGTSGGEGSRIQLFGSVRELAASSQVIVSGTVTSQSVVQDITPSADFTLANIAVDSVLKGGQLVRPGGAIIVRQTGSQAQPFGAPFMTPGGKYLLFLVPSGLTGEKSTQFYVTGASAGAFQLSSEESSSATSRTSGPIFTRLDPGSGDNLPSSLTLSQALG